MIVSGRFTCQKKNPFSFSARLFCVSGHELETDVCTISCWCMYLWKHHHSAYQFSGLPVAAGNTELCLHHSLLMYVVAMVVCEIGYNRKLFRDRTTLCAYLAVSASEGSDNVLTCPLGNVFLSELTRGFTSLKF